MNSLKTLAALVGGALIISVMYGLSVGDKDRSVSFDFDDGEGVRHIVNGDRGDFMLKEGDLTIEASWRGEYALSDDGTDIGKLDKKLEITREENDRTERVVFENVDDGVQHVYYREDEKQKAEPEADTAARALLLSFLRASGAKANERVAILMRKGGVEAVLEEMNALEGDHARQRYIATLTQSAELSPDQLSSLITIVSAMDGDHDIRMALEAIVENEKLAPAQMSLLFDAARNVEGDYDLRRIIEIFAESSLDEESITSAISLFENIESDHDLRLAGEALLSQATVTDANVAQLLSVATDRIDSNHDLRLLLSKAAPHLAGGPKVIDAWLKGFTALDSDHDRRITMEVVAEVDKLPEAITKALIEATHDIDSDHDRRLALVAFADRAKESSDLMAAYKSAAQSINAEYDRAQALEAIGETEND